MFAIHAEVIVCSNYWLKGHMELLYWYGHSVALCICEGHQLWTIEVIGQ